MPDSIVIVPYDPEWPKLFARLGADLRCALGDVAQRIDHIGSTSAALDCAVSPPDCCPARANETKT